MVFSNGGKGQLIFTFHNLRALEMLGQKSIFFSTTNPCNRSIRLQNVQTNHNLHGLYLRSLTPGGQKEEMYQETDSVAIGRAFRRAGKTMEAHVESQEGILVIVEGPTDKDALRSVLKAIFSSAEVHFHLIHGDITTEDAISGSNAKSHVAKIVAAEMKKYAYKDSNILQIVHLIDTDGAFIPDELVKERKEKGVPYFKGHIETGEVKYIQNRNQKKSSVVASLCTTGKIKAGIPYFDLLLFEKYGTRFA